MMVTGEGAALMAELVNDSLSAGHSSSPKKLRVRGGGGVRL